MQCGAFTTRKGSTTHIKKVRRKYYYIKKNSIYLEKKLNFWFNHEILFWFRGFIKINMHYKKIHLIIAWENKKGTNFKELPCQIIMKKLIKRFAVDSLFIHSHINFVKSKSGIRSLFVFIWRKTEVQSNFKSSHDVFEIQNE